MTVLSRGAVALVAAALSAALVGCSSSKPATTGSADSTARSAGGKQTTQPVAPTDVHHRGGHVGEAEIAACEADKRTVEVAAEAYYAMHGEYATAIDDARHSATTLVGAGLLREAPTATLATSGYVIGYKVTAKGYAISPASCR